MNAEDKVGPWRGTAIEEGFEGWSLLPQFKIVGTDSQRLEGEEGMGEFHFHKVEVTDSQLSAVIEAATRTLRPSWYFHLVKAGKMIVVFRGKTFEVVQGDACRLMEVKEFALAQGIHEDQLGLERLFENPYDE